MRKKKDNLDIDTTGKIEKIGCEEVASEGYSKYAKYVIQDRALPDVRDGLKPVQRRILYAMYKGGIVHSSIYKKSAKAVGDIMANYHPHGCDTLFYKTSI